MYAGSVPLILVINKTVDCMLSIGDGEM